MKSTSIIKDPFCFAPLIRRDNKQSNVTIRFNFNINRFKVLCGFSFFLFFLFFFFKIKQLRNYVSRFLAIATKYVGFACPKLGFELFFTSTPSFLSSTYDT